MLTYLLLIFFALLAFHIITRNNRRGKLLSKIDGLYPYPLIGNVLAFNVTDNHKLWLLGRKVIADYYPITRFWGLDSALVSIVHPDDLEVVLSSQKVITKGYVYTYLEPWLKTGLLTSTNEKWHQRRKVLTPGFHFGILKKYMEITNEQGEKLIEALKNDGQETVKSLIPFCSNYTLNIICESTMGVALDKLDESTIFKYKKAIHDMGKIVLYRLVRPYIASWMIRFLPKIGCLQREALTVLHGFTDQVIKERREYHKNTNNLYLNEYLEATECKNLYTSRKKRLAMLDLMLAAEKNGLIDKEGIKEEVDTFTFEGHDTTSMAMTYILMLLAENEEAQNLARAEVTEIIDRNDGKIGIAETQQFNYLERCIKESLRLYPPVTTLLRYTEEELQLKHALLPADTHIMISLWDTHRDVNFWEEPDKFDPDRFLSENCNNRHPFAYIPFSAGPRNCIGKNFAMMELKSLISRILYNFYLEPVDRTINMKMMADIILRPLDPVHIKFIKINK